VRGGYGAEAAEDFAPDGVIATRASLPEALGRMRPPA
jgi:hypothetical protein